MTIARAIKGRTRAGQIVAVLASPADLARATRLRRLPDLFELRLDALAHHLPAVENALPRLRAPLIITARHPAEGGCHQLSAARRNALLTHFFPHAAYLDLELRTAPQMPALLAAASARNLKIILSVHDFARAPNPAQLEQWVRVAHSLGADICKIVVQTDTAAELKTLIDFCAQTRTSLALCALGVGKFGRAARIHFARHRSALHYAHLGRAQAEGQLSLEQLRRLLRPPFHPPRAAARILP